MTRRTISDIITIQGQGLHRGNPVSLTIKPYDKGIAFIKNSVTILATPENVIDTRLNTMLGKAGECISTVEHMMSALYGLGITDCEIELEGDEMPVMDGSALPLLEALEKIPAKEIGTLDPIVISQNIRVGDDNAWVEIEPGSFSISYSIDFPEPAIGFQSYTYDGTDYKTRIAPARTFGRLKDVDMMRSMGLALGGSLDNAVVVDENIILNPEGLRFKDEFVRHKVLDLLGDLWLLGAPVTGRIKACKANHRLHVELAKMINSCRVDKS
jgi:UDP-3-O-[3-hydroxymyristoyl] N-acetylglucosamine deacetylase